MSIFNLTQHMATAEQLAAGVLEPANKRLIQDLLTFLSPPSLEEIKGRALALAALAGGHKAALIGGASYLMGPLEEALRAEGIRPLHSFTKRVSKETVLPDGSVKKENVFVHEAFVG